MQDNDKIKDIFSSKLKDFNPEVPGSVWDKIDSSLSVIPAPKPALKVIIRRLSMASGIAAAIVLGIFMLFNTQDVAKEFSVNLAGGHSFSDIEKIKNKQQEEQQPIIEKAGFAQKQHSASHADVYKQTAIQPQNESPTTQMQVKDNDNSGATKESVQDNSTAGNESAKDKQKPVSEAELKAKIAEFENSGQANNNLLAYNQSNKSKGFTIGLGGRSGLATSEEVTPHLRVSSSDHYYTEIATSGDDIPFYDKDKVNIDHKQPVSFGVMVGKKINNRLSVETGISYTYLSSDIKSDRTNDYLKSGSQYFHYLGIPLTVNYNFAYWGKAKFYVSLGGMAQKDIYGKLDLKQSIKDLLHTDQSIKENISQKNIQLSMMSSLGASFPVYKKLHIYTNVGVAHYFNADNDYRTIYSDRKTQLDLNVGFKFEF